MKLSSDSAGDTWLKQTSSRVKLEVSISNGHGCVQSLITSDDINEDSMLPRYANFALAYDGDIDGSSLQLEIMDCRQLFKKRPRCEVLSGLNTTDNAISEYQ